VAVDGGRLRLQSLIFGSCFEERLEDSLRVEEVVMNNVDEEAGIHEL